MPGLGRASCPEFLADPNLGTQPDRPPTDREPMVEPVAFRQQAGRSELGAAVPACGLVNTRKQEDFSSLLRRQLGPPLSPAEGNAEPAPSRFGAGRSDREMPASGELPAGLAPDAESGVRCGSGEAAAWLLLVSPPGGDAASSVATNSLTTMAPSRTLEPELALAAERWLRRLSWGGDGRRATARLELGAGALSGAELVVTAEGGHISLDLRLPTDAEGGLADRIRRRLEAKGYSADVTIR